MQKNSIHVTNDPRRQNAVGRATCLDIVQGRAGHGWQEFDPDNDNGIDGMIIMRNGLRDTGEFILAQIKCGSPGGYFKETAKRPNHFGVQVGEDYIQSHQPRWHNYPMPVILIYVDYQSKKAWWADLKDKNTYTTENKSLILVPKKQRFERHTFGELRKLPGFTHISQVIDVITMTNDEINYFILTDKLGIKYQAKKFFQEWGKTQSAERTNPNLGEVIVSRVGWRHIIRNGRNQNRIFQSFQLLSVAKRIVSEITKCCQVRQLEKQTLSNGYILTTDFLSLRALVKFPHRQSSLVQVVLKRKRWISDTGDVKSKVWFFSVYEPLRKIKMH